MVAPTILAHATDEVKDALPGQACTGATWSAASCSASRAPAPTWPACRPRPSRDGDEWIVTGQKVWTSGAHYSDIGEIICRTDPDLPKHKGLTGFVVDMKAPGVEIRPLRQMTGGASFNEVFFTDVRVPDDHRLGDVNQGWTVALTTLMNERASIGAGGGAGMGLGNATRLIEMVRHFGLDEDPLTRGELARLYSNFQVAKCNNQRAMDKIKAGQAARPRDVDRQDGADPQHAADRRLRRRTCSAPG